MRWVDFALVWPLSDGRADSVGGVIGDSLGRRWASRRSRPLGTGRCRGRRTSKVIESDKQERVQGWKDVKGEA